MARAFEPFFTTKGIGSGTGLGLSQVYGFVKQSAGNVKIYSESGQGTAVKIYLPRLMPDQARDMAVQEPLRAPSAEATLARPGETVLVVEDDAAVRSFTVSALQGHGYQVLEANDGPSALALLEAGAKVSLLFTDVGLPNGMTGAQLAKAAAAVRPEIKILYASGYTPNAIVHGGVLDDGVLLLPKPFTAEDLALKVRQALDTPQLEKGAKGTA